MQCHLCPPYLFAVYNNLTLIGTVDVVCPYERLHFIGRCARPTDQKVCNTKSVVPCQITCSGCAESGNICEGFDM